MAAAGERRRRRPGVIATSLTRRRYVKRASTVRYGPHGRANLADIWRRADLPADGRAPVVLQVPGGAWSIGMHRPQAYPLMSYLAERGWVCVSMAYRVSPAHTWPDHIVDVKRALAWIRSTSPSTAVTPTSWPSPAARRPADISRRWPPSPRRPAIPARLSPRPTRRSWQRSRCTAAMTGSPPPVRAVEFIAFPCSASSSKKKFATHRQVYLDASPITRCAADAPFFVLHGTDDSIIPVTEGREFVEALRAVSTAPVAYAEMPHAQHAFDFYGSPRTLHRRGRGAVPVLGAGRSSTTQKLTRARWKTRNQSSAMRGTTSAGAEHQPQTPVPGGCGAGSAHRGQRGRIPGEREPQHQSGDQVR